MFPGRPIANICRGALPEEARSEADIHSGLRGFDFYTLQRSPELWTSLCRWKEDVLEQADYHSPVAGDSLTVRVHEFGRREFLWRSPLPHPAIPNDTLHIITQNKRPRSLEADKILASKPTLSFEITQSVRTGHNYFSQVFFGRLVGTDTPLCLKLFDERLFRMPAPPKGSQSPLRRLSDMNFADDMMRREEAVYTRLSYLQGSAIPHCYGFHSVCALTPLAVLSHIFQFILPDGYNAWGMFLEIIDGVSLADVKLSSKNVDVQRDFVSAFEIFASPFDQGHSSLVYGTLSGRLILLALSKVTGMADKSFAPRLRRTLGAHRLSKMSFSSTSPSPITVSAKRPVWHLCEWKGI